MNKNSIFIIILILSLKFSATAIAEDNSLVFSTHVPKNSLAYKTTFVLMEEAFKRIGYGFTMESHPGKRALSMSNSGRTDGEAHRIRGINSKGKNSNLVRIPESQQVIYDYGYATRHIKLNNSWYDLDS